MKIRRVFERFEPYGWETPSWEIAAEVGLEVKDIVRLDTNTSPYSPASELRWLSQSATRLPVNEYPDTSYSALREGLSRYCGKPKDRFVVTNGADEGLDIIGKVLLEPGDEVIVQAPSYAMFRIVAEVAGAKVRYVESGPGFSLEAKAVLGAIGRKTKMVFLCNPNNPTGKSVPVREVKAIADSGVAVAVDEAYFEFSGRSAIDLTDRYENVIVCRTFSKAFSMAGVRVGYLVAKRETVAQLNLVRPPNSVSVVSLALAEKALSDLTEMRATVKKVTGERGRVVRALEETRSVHPYPSETNFILFKVAKAEKVHRRLLEKGFVLRNLAAGRWTRDCLRVTVSTRRINDAFLAALRESLS
jgi:histidinol-phosphate aminotransferase